MSEQNEPPEDRKIQPEGGTAHGKFGGTVTPDTLGIDGGLRVHNTDPDAGISSNLKLERLPLHKPIQPKEN